MNTSIIHKAKEAIARALLKGTDLAIYSKSFELDKVNASLDRDTARAQLRSVMKEYDELLVKSSLEPRPMSIEKLTMKQLGSYVPDFIDLSHKGDEFKSRMGLLCSNLKASEEWNYLINHLKQDQVNLSLFAEQPKNDAFVRGSINGIYVVDDQVTTLAATFNSQNIGLKKGKKS